MKRVLLSTIGTIAGLVALLSFKTHGQAVASGPLPEAALPGSTTSSSTPSGSASASGAARARSGSTGSSAAKSRAVTTPAATTRSFTGNAITTRYGIVQVKVTVSGSAIKNVAFTQLTAFDGRSQEINSQAAPILLQETLSAQSAQIDTVSGATYTTDGYLQSLQSALDQAGLK